MRLCTYEREHTRRRMVDKTLRNPFTQTVIQNDMAVACYDANILLMAFSFQFQHTELALIVSIEFGSLAADIF